MEYKGKGEHSVKEIMRVFECDESYAHKIRISIKEDLPIQGAKPSQLFALVESQLVETPRVIERFADNGEHSHWILVNEKGQEIASSELVESKPDLEKGEIAEIDKKKIPQVIRFMKIPLVQCDLQDSTYQYFGNIFKKIEDSLADGN